MKWDAFDGYSGVYIIGCGDLAKIGHSGNFGARFRNLEDGLPGPMRLYRWMEVVRRRELEKELHSRFRALRVHREWFRFEGELVEFVRPYLDLHIDGTSATEDNLKEAVWRIAVSLSPSIADYKPEPLPDLPRRLAA